jgi:hypothetical protein
MSNLLHTRTVRATVTGGGGGISGSAAYSNAVDCSRASAVKVRLVYTKAGINVDVGIVDDSASGSDAPGVLIAADKDPLLSTRQSTGTSATSHTISATGRAVLVANLGGLVGRLRLIFTGTGAGVVGDILTYEITIVEE